MRKIILLLFLLMPVQALALEARSFVTGEYLLEWCEAYPENDCGGYVLAVVDLHETLVTHKFLERMWCVPDKVETDQIVQLVTNYLKENPQLSQFNASGLVVNALTLSFPCR